MSKNNLNIDSYMTFKLNKVKTLSVNVVANNYSGARITGYNGSKIIFDNVYTSSKSFELDVSGCDSLRISTDLYTQNGSSSSITFS